MFWMYCLSSLIPTNACFISSQKTHTHWHSINRAYKRCGLHANPVHWLAKSFEKKSKFGDIYGDGSWASCDVSCCLIPHYNYYNRWYVYNLYINLGTVLSTMEGLSASYMNQHLVCATVPEKQRLHIQSSNLQKVAFAERSCNPRYCLHSLY